MSRGGEPPVTGRAPERLPPDGRRAPIGPTAALRVAAGEGRAACAWPFRPSLALLVRSQKPPPPNGPVRPFSGAGIPPISGTLVPLKRRRH